jgi:type III secretion system TyeA family effector delivery regulator
MGLHFNGNSPVGRGGPAARGSRPAAPGSGPGVHGSHKGRRLSLKGPDAAATTAPDFHGQPQLQAQERHVGQRGASADNAPRVPRAGVLLSQARQFGDTFGVPDMVGHVRRHARALLTGRPPPPALAGRRAAAVARHLGGQLAMAAIEAEDDALMVACVTPAPGDGEDLQGFMQWLRQVLPDPGKLEDPDAWGEAGGFARDVLQDGQKAAPRAIEDFLRKLTAAQYEPDALADLLRDAQGLRPARSLRQGLREELAEEARELACTPHGMLARATLGKLGTVAQSGEPDPEGFLATYEKLGQATGFCGALKILLERYVVAQLPEAIDTMRKALAEELETAAGSGTIRLGMTLAALWDTSAVTTFNELVNETAAAVARTPGGAGDGRRPDAGILMSGLLDLIAAGNAVPVQFRQIAEKLALPRGAPTVALLSGVQFIIRELPDRAFNDRQQRIALRDAVQDALDEAIDAEEELLDLAQGIGPALGEARQAAAPQAGSP